MELVPCELCGESISSQAEACAKCGHPSSSKNHSMREAILAAWGLAGTFLGLSGIADGFIEWRDFFEHGFMGYYRHLKELVLSVLPVKVWWWIPDYLVLGSVALFSVKVTPSTLPQMGSAKQHTLVGSIISWMIRWAIWPVFLLIGYWWTLFDIEHQDMFGAPVDDEFEEQLEREKAIEKADTRRRAGRIIRRFLFVCAFCLSLIFVLSDYLSQIN